MNTVKGQRILVVDDYEEMRFALVSLFERYGTERREGERFYEWARRMPNPELRATLQTGTNGANGDRK